MKPFVAGLFRALVLAAAVATTATVAGCGPSGPQFRASYAQGYARGGTVSVFGVFKDGRMDPNLWNELGGTLLPLGQCPAGYSSELVAQKRDLASAMDDYVRANGVTDALLAEWGAASRADTILLFTIAGHPPVQTGPTYVTEKVRPPGMMTKSASPYDVHRPTDGSVFQVTASLYSVRAHRPIAQLDMTYAERDVDGALREFGRRMQSELFLSACDGWNADAQGLDEARIRALKE